MFPLYDDNPTEIFPLFTLLIIAGCAWVWWSLQGAGMSEAALGNSICALGAIPAEVTGTVSAAGGPCRLGGITWQALLLSGALAAGVHIALDPSSPVPLVGASGAISAVMGAYLVLYPRVRVATLFFFFVFIRVVPLPAWVMLGYWIAVQIAYQSLTAPGGGGVAYLAHVGGFAAGVVLIFLFRKPQLVDAKRSGVTLRREQLEHGGWW